MNIGDEEVLENLCKLKKSRIVVNYSEWMSDPTHWMFEKYAPFYDRLSDGKNKILSVFWNKDPKSKRPDLMHHKFLVGYEEAGKDKSKSLLYGSFNMSYSSPQNLDSLLIFRQNARICGTFENIALVLVFNCAPWIDIKGESEQNIQSKTYLHQYIRSKTNEETSRIYRYWSSRIKKRGHEGKAVFDLVKYLNAKYDDFYLIDTKQVAEVSHDGTDKVKVALGLRFKI